ncbi:DUF6916 family protein [Diaphorobacter caeni]|uniref:DUF6916 family protein n=1 Tax=Diaphorobacter caeni TaxID=2784387 RepID=UPI00188FEDEC|nr:hypothetical protein [Diaphorobacter caeni]MBF5004225.1 hypothetical protein [Diaphorobacter caeni]
MPATAALSGGMWSAAAAHANQSLGGESLTRQTFLPLLNQSFMLSNDGDSGAVQRTVRLTSVEDLPHCIDREKSFRVVFEVQGADGAQQALWQVTHPRLGQHAIFMSPNDPQGREIEAIFNRG